MMFGVLVKLCLPLGVSISLLLLTIYLMSLGFFLISVPLVLKFSFFL